MIILLRHEADRKNSKRGDHLKPDGKYDFEVGGEGSGDHKGLQNTLLNQQRSRDSMRIVFGTMFGAFWLETWTKNVSKIV